MAKRVFIVHKWGGSPEEDWYPWLRKELIARGVRVFVPRMPNAEEPSPDEWVTFLREQLNSPDQETFFVGHSIGCQTILRYWETLSPEVKVGGAVFVGGWFDLKPGSIGSEEEEIVKPWLNTDLQWDKVSGRTGRIVAFFSDNDPYVHLKEADIFREKLGAKLVIERGKGHYEIKQFPGVLEQLLKML